MIEYILIGIALAMDCFSVSIAAGIQARRTVLTPMLLMIVAFGVFQSGMTALGYYGMSIFSGWIETFDHWIAFALLTYLGYNMISTLWKTDEDEKMNLLAVKNIPLMAVATSIDALAVGISFACISTESILLATLTIGICSSIFTIAGLSLGIQAGKRIPFPVEPIGGAVLITIGVKILIEHL